MLEIMLVHFILGPQHCVGVQSYIIRGFPQDKHTFRSDRSGKHTASVFSAYFLTAQNLKMKGGVRFTKNFTIYRFTRRHIPEDLNLINIAQKLKDLNRYIIVILYICRNSLPRSFHMKETSNN